MGKRIKKRLTADDLYNGWLTKYHGITVQWLIENEPELIKTPDWYKKYSVTSAQHDEWYEDTIAQLSRHYQCSRKMAKRRFCFDYLNIAPSIIEESNTT